MEIEMHGLRIDVGGEPDVVYTWPSVSPYRRMWRKHGDIYIDLGA